MACMCCALLPQVLVLITELASFVPHDQATLITLYGGPEGFVR